MVNYREILRLRSLDYSQRQVAASVYSSRSTISEVYQLADKTGLSWPLPSDMSNTDVRNLFYPEKAVKSGRKIPDCSYLHKELAKPGVTLTLLWSEYWEQCHSEQLIPYQYTQFCEYYRTYAKSDITKRRATLYFRVPSFEIHIAIK